MHTLFDYLVFKDFILICKRKRYCDVVMNTSHISTNFSTPWATGPHPMYGQFIKFAAYVCVWLKACHVKQHARYVCMLF